MLACAGAGGVNARNDPEAQAPKSRNVSQKVYVIAIVALVGGIILLSFSACILYRRRAAERPGT